VKRGGPLTRRTRLRASTPLVAKVGLRRSRYTPGSRLQAAATTIRRDWTPARAKVTAEGRCRARDGLCLGPLQAAHVIGREYDPAHPTREGWRIVLAEHVVPLCEHHHRRYDAHELNLLPFLRHEEWEAACLLVGLGSAERRVMGGAWREAA
jgi:hypothetical protein